MRTGCNRKTYLGGNMTKEEFLESLDRMIASEETLVPIYLRHMEAILQWSGMSDENKTSAKIILETLARDSKKHSSHFKELKKRVATGELNVY